MESCGLRYHLVIPKSYSKVIRINVIVLGVSFILILIFIFIDSVFVIIQPFSSVVQRYYVVLLHTGFYLILECIGFTFGEPLIYILLYLIFGLAFLGFELYNLYLISRTTLFNPTSVCRLFIDNFPQLTMTKCYIGIICGFWVKYVAIWLCNVCVFSKYIYLSIIGYIYFKHSRIHKEN